MRSATTQSIDGLSPKETQNRSPKKKFLKKKLLKKNEIKFLSRSSLLRMTAPSPSSPFRGGIQ